MPLIAQLTDPHVTASGMPSYVAVDTIAHLRRAVAHLNALPLDGIVITGDLIDDSLPESYAALRPELDALTAPWWPLPGNHDGPDFWEVFSDRMTDPVAGVGHVVRLEGLRIVMLDTSIPGEPGGRIDDARADWLGEAMAGTEPTLLAMHHPPVEVGIEGMDRLGLAGAERLVPILEAQPPLAILAGHIHRVFHGQLAGVPVLTGPGSAHGVGLDLRPGAPLQLTTEPPGVLLHDVGAHGLRTHLSFIGDFPAPAAGG